MWSENVLDRHEQMEGKLVKVTGDVRIFQGKPSITITAMEHVFFAGRMRKDFLPKFANLDGVAAKLKEMISEVETPHYRALLDRIFGDEAFFKRFHEMSGWSDYPPHRNWRSIRSYTGCCLRVRVVCVRFMKRLEEITDWTSTSS